MALSKTKGTWFGKRIRYFYFCMTAATTTAAMILFDQ